MSNRFRHKPLHLPERAFRSSITNAASLLNGIDGRTDAARRYRDLAASFASDLGGCDQITTGQEQLCRAASGLAVLREALDARVIRGESVDVGTYVKLTNSLNRVLTTIGLKRRAKDVTPPNPLDFAKHYKSIKAAAADIEEEV